MVIIIKINNGNNNKHITSVIPTPSSTSATI